MKKVLSLLIISILSFTIVSATLYDFAKEESLLPENILIIDEGDCSSFRYNLFVGWLKDFIVEIETTNTNEQIYVILRENNCEWHLEVLAEISGRPDILVSGTWDEESPSLDNQIIKAKSFKGFFLGNIVKDYL